MDLMFFYGMEKAMWIARRYYPVRYETYARAVLEAAKREMDEQ